MLRRAKGIWTGFKEKGSAMPFWKEKALDIEKKTERHLDDRIGTIHKHIPSCKPNKALVELSKCSDPSKRIWLRTGKDNTPPNKHLYNKMASSHTFHFVPAWWHHKYSDFRKSHQGKPRKGQVTEASFKHLIIQGLHGNAWKFNPRFRQFSFFKMKIIQVTNVKNRPIVCVLIQKRIPDELKEGSLLPYQRALSVGLPYNTSRKNSWLFTAAWAGTFH